MVEALNEHKKETASLLSCSSFFSSKKPPIQETTTPFKAHTTAYQKVQA